MSYVSGTSSINNSLIENAFVDDSADISSDETLFSISPNGFEHLDSTSETPLPTIVSPIHTSIIDNLAFRSVHSEDSNVLKTIAEDIDGKDEGDDEGDITPVDKTNDYKQPQVTFKIIVSPLKIMKPTQQLQSVTIAVQPAQFTQTQTEVQTQIKPFVTIKTPMPPKTETALAQAIEPVEIISDTNQVKHNLTHHMHHCQCGQVKMTQEEILNTNKKEFPNQASLNPKISSLTIAFNDQGISKSNFDMKSQMAKYNEYLHYLRYGFPKRK